MLVQIILFLCLALHGSSLFWGLQKKTTPSKKQTSAFKSELLDSIGKARRRDGGKDGIISAVERLESLGLAVDPKSLTGKWSLVYSTRSSKVSIRSSSSSTIDRISNALYGFLFKFLPRLAGGAEETDGQLATNIQAIDLVSGTIENTVQIRRPFPLTLVVDGEARQSETPDTIEVIFTACRVNGLAIPLPRPKGTLRTTFCDESLRVSRGGQGGLFVVKRLP